MLLCTSNDLELQQTASYFAYLKGLVWWKREEGGICANLTPTPYSQWHRTLYMSSSAKRRRWNAYPPYISSFEKYCLCASLFLAGNYSNSPPLTSPPLHLSTLWKKKESCYFYIYLLNPWYIFWVLHLQLVFNPTFKGFFFPTVTRIGNIFQKSILKTTKDPEMTKPKLVCVCIRAASLQVLLWMQNLP